jgi:ribosomal RNA-processing protein 36
VEQSRDPRFLPLAGEFSAERFRAQYRFLADAHKAELDALRENLKRARRLLVTSPRNLLYERDQEVNRLELAVKRAESAVNKDRNDLTESETLLKLTKEEKERRNQGKKHWWLKGCKHCLDFMLRIGSIKFIQPKNGTF